MRTFGARSKLDPDFLGVEAITTNTVKRDFASFTIVKIAVPSVIIDPQKNKYSYHQHSVERDIEREFKRNNHGGKFTGISPNAKRK